MQIKTFYFNPIRVCTYVLVDDTQIDDAPRRAIIVDAGCYSSSEQQRLRELFSREHLQPVAHLLTHAHLDHVFGCRFLYDEYSLTPYMHPADEFLLRRLPQQAAAFGIPWTDENPEEYISIHDNDILDFGFTQIKVLHTPGHTPGCVCYLIEKATQENDEEATKEASVLLSGDTLFQNGYGRTDLPGGSYQDLMTSLLRLQQLPPSTTVLPGHGYPTTIGQELTNNQ